MGQVIEAVVGLGLPVALLFLVGRTFGPVSRREAEPDRTVRPVPPTVGAFKPPETAPGHGPGG